MGADGVHRHAQLIGDLVRREVGWQVAQDAGLAVGELFIQAAAAGPSRLAAGRRRGPVPGAQALDLDDQGGVGGAVPGVALEQARRGLIISPGMKGARPEFPGRTSARPAWRPKTAPVPAR